mmetsp:Transcript_23821/g.34805  ORF Transcript_23821/g.34805 Transcript_23821/m.34805 type:complete len:209 (+) Transcript_23821:99-725(+)
MNTSSRYTVTIHDNDVLCGRGGASNKHKGNIHYRNLVQAHQESYLNAKKRDKSKIAKLIVSEIRHLGGRFLKREDEGNVWVEVGDKKAVEKTSQALREGLDVRRHLFGSAAPSNCSEGKQKKKKAIGVNGGASTRTLDSFHDFHPKKLRKSQHISISQPTHLLDVDGEEFTNCGTNIISEVVVNQNKSPIETTSSTECGKICSVIVPV